ncbi:MAG: tyrosine-type recombinase/integrase [Mycobacterium sp.]|nr:tyrosine-type recombinase/integrase [Mycobacterium sp.]
MARWDEKRGCWRIVVDVSTPGGRRRRRYRDVHTSRTRAGRKKAELVEAQLRLDAARAAEAEWPGRSAGEDTFATAAAGWVERTRGRWSPKTLRETRYALRRYILPHLGATLLDRVSPAQIETMYAEWAHLGHSASAMRRWHGMINAIFHDAERLGIVTGPNPMVRVRPAGGHAPERNIPTPEQIRRIIAAAHTPLVRLFFELAVATGARRGTLVALRWCDVDVDAGRLSYVQAIAEGDDGTVIKTNKAGRAYSVSLSGSALAALRMQRRRAAETALALGLGAELGDLYVFSDDGGVTPWSLRWPSHAWRQACIRAGVGSFRLHDARHFCATQLLAKAVPVRVVADRLGCTESNVIRTYSHRVASPEDARAADVMAQVLEAGLS